MRTIKSKGLLYLDFRKDYFRLFKAEPQVVTRTGPFFLDLEERMQDGHFDQFDAEGLPVRMYRGRVVHNYTTLCAFAFGHWQRFLMGVGESADFVLKVAEYIRKTGKVTPDGGFLLLTPGSKGEHDGFPSAMNQGHAVGVLCRAHELTGDETYIKIAEDCIRPFDLPVEFGGVRAHFSAIDSPWFEERAEKPYRHIFNGMIYALVGIRDYLRWRPDDSRALRLWGEGIDSVEKALPLFDLGYWSLYWYGEGHPHYVASLIYQNLHVCQLRYVFVETGIELFDRMALRFSGYLRSPFSRARAAGRIALEKSAGKFWKSSS